MLQASPRGASAPIHAPPQMLSHQGGTPRASLPGMTGDSTAMLSYAVCTCTSVVGMGVAAPPPITRINASRCHPQISLRGYSPAAPPPTTGTRYAPQGPELVTLCSGSQDARTPVPSCSLSPRNPFLQVAGSAVAAPGCSLSPRKVLSPAVSFGMETHGVLSESSFNSFNTMTKASNTSTASLCMSPRSHTVCRQVSVSGSPVNSSLGHRSPRCTIYRAASSPGLSQASASTASGSSDSDSAELTSNPSVDAEEPPASSELPTTSATKHVSECTDMSRSLKVLVPFDVLASTCNRHSGSPRGRSNLSSDAYPRSRSNSRAPISPRASSATSGYVAPCKSPRLSQSASTSALHVVIGTTQALAKSSIVSEAVGDMLESDCRKLKVEQYLAAHEKQASWLKTALQQQINAYQNEWTVLRKHQVEQDRARTVILQRQAEAEQMTKKHIQVRQAREDIVFQNNQELVNKRMVKVKALQDRELAREQRLAREREKVDNELAKRAQSEAWRRKEVRMEGIRLAEEQSLAHAAKAKLKSDKVEAFVGETRRIYQRRKVTNEIVENSMASMKSMISQQRTRSIIDVEALTEHMLELLAAMED